MDADKELPADLARETEALRRIARGVLFEPALADDAVQEAWLAALRAPHAAVQGGWLGEAVKRVARGMRRREARVAARERAAAKSESQRSAAETAERIELLRTLLGALESLDEPYRTAVRLRFVDDLPPRAIAERLGQPVETVRTHVRRGVERMRAKLDSEHRGRRESFLGALAPVVGAEALKAGLAAHTGLGTIGGVLVGTKAKWLAACGLLAALAAWWKLSPGETVDMVLGESSVNGSLEAPARPESSANSVASQVVLPRAAADTRAGREVVAGTRSAWTLAGSTLLARKTPVPHERVTLTLRRGFDEGGEVLLERELVSNDVGVFELALERPTCGVRASVRGAKDGYAVSGDACLIPSDEASPQPLTVAYFPMDVRVRGRVLELDGTPIEGAYVDGLGPELARTDRHGAFEVFLTSTSDSQWLLAWSEHHAIRHVALEVDGPGEIAGFEVRLDRGRCLVGCIVELDGLPIAGARVRGSYALLASAVTNEDGRFELADVPPQPYWFQLEAELDGRTIASCDILGSELPKDELLLRANHHRTLIGRVVDERGAPVAAAQIAVIEPRSLDEVVSDDDGRFELSAVRDDASRIQVEKRGFATYSGPLDGTNDGSLVLVLGGGRELAGHVRDAEGQPIPGAIVSPCIDRVPREGWVSARADGSWTLEHLGAAERTELDVRARGFVEARVLVPDDATTLDVVLQRAGGLAGRVVDAGTGEPVTRFRVRFAPPEARASDVQLGGYNVIWHEYGREFETVDGRWDTADEALESDRVIALEIGAPGYATRILPRVVTRIDPRAEELVIELGRARSSVAGLVVEKHTGRPIAAARVQATSKREPHYPHRASRLPSSTTDTAGAFRIEDLPDETVRLYVEAEGFAPALDEALEPRTGETRRTIELTRGATLRGIVRDAGGAPLANERVALCTDGPAEVPYRNQTTTTDAEGEFEFRSLPSGKYTVSHDLRDRGAWLLQCTRGLHLDEDQSATIELHPPGTLRLRGELRASVPLPGNLAIRARREGDGADLACVSDGARFELEGLAPGRWSVSATWYDGRGEHDLVGEVRVDVGERDPDPVVIDLSPPRRR